MQSQKHQLKAVAIFAGSLLIAFHADASRASVLSIPTRTDVVIRFTPLPFSTPARPARSSTPQDIDRHIEMAATEHGVSRELIRAVIETESRFDPLAISARGACGLMQLMPATARRFGVLDCHDVSQNIHGGTRFLKALLARYDGDISLSMAAYNAGEGAVARHGGIPPYRQTRAYVRNVERLLAAGSEARATGS